MPPKKPAGKLLSLLPLLLGAAALASFALYFYSANHVPYRFIDVILLGPICSLAGIVAAVAVRKREKRYPGAYALGLCLCILGFAACALVFAALAAFAAGLAALPD